MIALAAIDVMDSLVKQAPAAAAVVLVVWAFLRYLTKAAARDEAAEKERRDRDCAAEEERRERDKVADKERQEREERLEILRTQAMQKMGDSCHANHRQVSVETSAAMAGLAEVLKDNTKMLGIASEVYRGDKRA